MSASFAQNCGKNFYPEPEENLMRTLFTQYERVVIETIITTFALDFMFADRHGGDVDTIHNVRQIGKDDGLMTYKNKKNESAYNVYMKENPYDKDAYHADSRYRAVVREAKNDFNNYGIWQDDTYVQGNKVAPVRNNTLPRNKQGQLDHVQSAKEIHEDRGVVLSGLDGMALANSQENLRYTNAALNLNMSSMSVEEYIKWCEDNPRLVNWNGNKGEPLPDDVKNKLREEYNRAKKATDEKLNKAYYASPQFRHDVVCAATDVGLKMGLRQTFGFVFMEVWFAVKEQFSKLPEPFDLSKALNAVAEGVKRGIETAKVKYKELLAKFGEGFIAGVLSSISTTICNIFFTTAKNTVKLIRRTYASLVQAAEVLFLNPENYLFGERMREVAKIIATGASVAVGTILTDQIAKIADKIPVEMVAEILPEFCGALTTGLMTCTLLFYFDRSELINKLVCKLNDLPTISTEVNYFKEQAKYFEIYAAQLMSIDIETFKKETQMYSAFCEKLDSVSSPYELNYHLKEFYKKLDWKLPWEGDFNSFMSNKSNVLRFE